MFLFMLKQQYIYVTHSLFYFGFKCKFKENSYRLKTNVICLIIRSNANNCKCAQIEAYNE